MIHLKCDCCGFEKDFADEEEAFDAGWDAPPHFTGYVACDLCPAVCIVMGLSHEIAHGNWELQGRPNDFDERCLPDDQYKEVKRRN